MTVTTQPIEPKYKKENGLWVLDIDAVKLPEDFPVQERSIIYLPPGQLGGNHKHPRREAFIGVGEHLKIVWQDENDQHRELLMNPGGKLQVCLVPSMLPHAVVNESPHSFAILVEYADREQQDVERIAIVE